MEGHEVWCWRGLEANDPAEFEMLPEAFPKRDWLAKYPAAAEQAELQTRVKRPECWIFTILHPKAKALLFTFLVAGRFKGPISASCRHAGRE